ncbi:hypothetical protein MMC28_001528 [Mycoblastus sanguinarius]|nr:hypothetical protein [Mycoblastus sanguinarius]
MTSSLSSKLGLDGHQKAFSEANVQPAEDSSSHADHSKPSVKASVNHLYLDAPLQPTFSRPSDDVSDISLYSADNDNERRAGRPLTVSAGIRLSSRSPAPPKTWRGKIHTAWESNKGLALVTLAQLFAVMMNVTTRLLEMDGDHGKGMHPFQAKIEGAPFGSPEIRKLLIARGVGGFFGGKPEI